MKPLAFAVVATTLFLSNAALANTRICVSVQQKSWYKPVRRPRPRRPLRPRPTRPRPRRWSARRRRSAGGPRDRAAGAALRRRHRRRRRRRAPGADRRRPARAAARAQGAAAREPARDDPTLHLRRMLEYEVTHEPGFAAVDERCEQRLVIELYQLESGWTVFGRYSGTEREEKVDHAELDEFAELAQRLVYALLRNKFDQPHHHARERAARRQRAEPAHDQRHQPPAVRHGHAPYSSRTCRRRRGQTAAARDRGADPHAAQHPVGYRRKLRAWGLDAFGRLNLGTENTGVRSNDLGGHVDYSKSGLLGLNFLHYTDAPGVNSFYFGGGAAFEIAQFEVIRPLDEPRRRHARHALGGGLNIDLLVGYEFMRASSVHFFGQLEVERARLPRQDRERFAARSTPGCPA